MLVIIPARAGSKGIPNKNIKLLCGETLIQRTLKQFDKSDLLFMCISTDIKTITQSKEFYIVERPEELSEDDTPMLDVIKHALDYYEILFEEMEIDEICLLQPTSPFRTAQDINEAVRLFWRTGADSLVSGYYMQIKEDGKVFDKHKAEKHFQRNGAIFITKREMIEAGKIFDENSIKFEMPKSRSIDIDNEDDWKMAECLIKGGILDEHN